MWKYESYPRKDTELFIIIVNHVLCLKEKYIIMFKLLIVWVKKVYMSLAKMIIQCHTNKSFLHISAHFLVNFILYIKGLRIEGCVNFSNYSQKTFNILWENGIRMTGVLYKDL